MSRGTRHDTDPAGARAGQALRSRHGARPRRLRLLPGEILGVIGDNGAGKSTLIKALTGASSPTTARSGWTASWSTSRSPGARRAGIETVYQNLALSPASSSPPTCSSAASGGAGLLRPLVPACSTAKGMEREAARELNALGLLTIQNISQPVETLSGGQRQGVAVARAAAFGRQRRDHGRADRGARREGIAQGARPDPRRARARPADRADQPQHAARLRGRRPHPHPAARPAHRGRSTRRTTPCRTRVAIMTGAMAPPETMAA